MAEPPKPNQPNSFVYLIMSSIFVQVRLFSDQLCRDQNAHDLVARPLLEAELHHHGDGRVVGLDVHAGAERNLVIFLRKNLRHARTFKCGRMTTFLSG